MGGSDGREAGIGLPEVALALPALQANGKWDVVKKNVGHEFEAGTASLMSIGAAGWVETGAVAVAVAVVVPDVGLYRS